LIIATGSEVHPALEAAYILEQKGIGTRVVSMPSWEIFEQQDQKYKKMVIPDEVRLKVAVEAGISMGWHKYVGCEGEIIGIDRFGKSAPFKVLFEKFGFTGSAIADRIEKRLREG
jgi:transketolase